MLHKSFLSLLTILFISNQTYPGFPCNTQVKTQYGYKNISAINLGDIVESCWNGVITYDRVV